MSHPLPISGLTIWRLSIPMRAKFKHAAAERQCAEPLIVALELADRTIGYGETHPRPYVTGESPDDAIRAIREIFVPLLVETRPANFGEAIEAAANLPIVHPNSCGTGSQPADSCGTGFQPLTDSVKGFQPVTAARAAIELALLDAYGKAFGRSLEAVAGWLDEKWLGPPGSEGSARFSGVVSGEDPHHVARSIRRMRLLRLPHFKLKVGDEHDDERLAAAMRILGRGLRAGRITLRLDANGAWTLDQAMSRLSEWEALPITCVEQPLPKGDFAAWQKLAAATNLPLMADESLVTPDDAEALIVHRAASWFNIRISKNGGLIPAVRLVLLARRHNIECQLGCMVGETSILSAAGRWFLQLVPGIRIAEGSFGGFLLTGDVATRPLRFGWRGSWKPLRGPGLGVDVVPQQLDRFAAEGACVIPF
jgi:muconate cycloisomerase